MQCLAYIYAGIALKCKEVQKSEIKTSLRIIYHLQKLHQVYRKEMEHK